MKDNENLYDKIRELIGKEPGNLNIMEDHIDVDLQAEYFEYSKKVSRQFDESWAIDQIEMLFDPDFPNDAKKQLLARLATSSDVKAYRAIESYASEPDNGLRDWGLLALQESRMHLESHLLEENQVFISTGLGGRDHKLRYFVVLISRGRKSLNEFQVKIVGKEFPYVLGKYDGEVEEFDASGYLAAFMLLLPIQHAVKDVFTEGINECNQYGDFLRENCIVTNVKRLTFGEVVEFIEKKSDHNETPPAT